VVGVDFGGPAGDHLHAFAIERIAAGIAQFHVVVTGSKREILSENGLLEVSVLLNARGRDPGGVIADAEKSIQRTVKLPPGYYYNWSGQFENEVRAKDRLRIVMPVVIGIIYILLFLTYRSFLEAAHVLLAVPFALTGGLYLLWLLGYNFSVAVWVGFIALFGTAVQTTVVMVIYLEEAVARKRKERGALTVTDLREAVMEGALLRLRPKVMTVSTVVAGLLPIFWSNRVGSEVILPLATPVLGGMVSSLAHVLIVTPVIFLWLRERELRRRQPVDQPHRLSWCSEFQKYSRRDTHEESLSDCRCARHSYQFSWLQK
jgi:Cu(I)/Ag(I) efflux system membrane protein CusA/SilA